MRAYKLWTVKNDPDTKEPASFYFRKKSDADIFIDVFKDRWVHVEFTGAWVDVPQNEETFVLDEIDLNPEIKAEENVDWGVEFSKKHGDDALTLDEKRFLDKLGQRFKK